MDFSLQPYPGVYENDQLLVGIHTGHHGPPNFDPSWTPIDPALYNPHPEFTQKPNVMNHSQFTCQPSSVYNHMVPYSEPISSGGSFVGWSNACDSYEQMRYNSPSGHYGGNVSEASSDYTVSPHATRQHATFSPVRLVSPPVENQYSHHSWSTNDSLVSVPTSSQDRSQMSIAPREVEYPGMSEMHMDQQESEAHSASLQLPIHAPEELELSESIATFTPSSRANTTFSSAYDSSSARSSPAQDHDSDSDFNPRRSASRPQAITRNSKLRSPRQSLASFATVDQKNRVHKPSNSRSLSGREKSKPRPIPQMTNALDNDTNSKLPKSFPCTFHLFGCLATFANKNEWKRHVSSQHLQLGFYRCDLGACNPDNDLQLQMQYMNPTGQGNRSRSHNKRRSASLAQVMSKEGQDEVKVYNEFNRKDLFTQHCRRMHGPSRHLLDDTTRTNQSINVRLRAQGRRMGSGKPINTKEDETAFEEELEYIRMRCWKLRRHAPERTTCGFCGRLFEASAHSDKGNDDDGQAEERAWEERMEHLGRHYERDGCSPSMENVDQELLEWGIHEGIIEMRADVGAWLTGYSVPSDEQEEEEQRREGLRRRGPKRRIISKLEAHIKTEGDRSDVDAMADDD